MSYNEIYDLGGKYMVFENFKTLKELYDRLAPALKSKVKELKAKGYSFLTEKDLWDYLKNNKWNTETDLTLYDLVSEIFYIEETDLVRYLSLINRIELKETDSFSALNKTNEEDTIL